MLRTTLKIAGTLVSFLSTAILEANDIKEVVSIWNIEIQWSLLTLVLFGIFVVWWIGGLEVSMHRIRNTKPNLIFSEYRETPLFENNKPIYHMLQAWFVNKPKVPTKDSVAEDVTARIHFYDTTTKGRFSVYGLWIIGEAYDFAGVEKAENQLDTIPPNAKPSKLPIAIKWQEDESAYAYVWESMVHSQTGDLREVGREIKRGSHYIEVCFEGVGLRQPSSWFKLKNLGANNDLEFSPIKKPNLRKEGFGIE